MRIKSGYILRKMTKEYIVVAVGERGKEFNGMLMLNEAGAYLWKLFEKYHTKEEVIAEMLEYYDNITEDMAAEEVNEFMEQIAFTLETE